MKKFFKNLARFFIVFGLIFLIGIFLPVTPGAKKNMLAFKIQKDSLLKNVESPRIIFVGGSNLVFGLNSQIFKDSLNLNPINAGLAASEGLIFMMDDVLSFVRKGDIIVLAPEYQNYFGNFAYGGNDLFRLLMDVQRSGFYKLRPKHIPNLIKSWPTYFQSKFRVKSYFFDSENDIYGKHIFNEYGDSDFHWSLESREFEPLHPLKNGFNPSIIDEIVKFEAKVSEKGGQVFITYPACQKESVEINQKQISKVERALSDSGLKVLGTVSRYSFPDSLMFEQAYHLSKPGVDLRTYRLIENLRDIDD